MEHKGVDVRSSCPCSRLVSQLGTISMPFDFPATTLPIGSHCFMTENIAIKKPNGYLMFQVN